MVAGISVLVWMTWMPDARHLAVGLVLIYLLGWIVHALWSRLWRREILARFIMTSVTLAALLLFVEGLAWLRVVDYRQVFSTPGYPYWWNRPGHLTDPELFWVVQPLHRVHVRYTRGDIGEFLCLPRQPPLMFDVRYDRRGFRNERDVAQAEIAVIGDSFVEAPMAPAEVLMTTLLEGLQGKPVANFGMSGYGPQHELVVLKRHVLPLEPSSIVWIFYEGNDLSDVQAYEGLTAHAAEFVHSPWERSFMKNALWGALRVWEHRPCTPRPQLAKQYATIRTSDGSRKKIYFWDGGQALGANDLVALQKTGRMLAEAYRLSRDRNIRFVVVFAPVQYRVYHGTSSVVEESEAITDWAVNDLPERLLRIAGDISSEIQFLDLTPIFQRHAANGALLFLPDDMHWSPDGHRVVAEAIHELLATSAGKSPDRTNSVVSQ